MLLAMDFNVLAGCLTFVFFLSGLLHVYQRLTGRNGIPNNIPWVGVDGGAWTRAKASKRSFFGMREMIRDGYKQYSKRHQVFVLPNVVTGPEVILPTSQLSWLLDQPDHVLNQQSVNSEFLHAERTMLHKHIVRDTVHGRVIRREMTKDLDSYSANIVEEIEYALADNWGVDPAEWREVALYDTILDVIARISNRVLVGKPLCRNEEYLKHSRSFNRTVVISAGLLNLCPVVLQPVVGMFVTLVDKWHYRQMAKFILPIIEDRIRKFRPGLDYRKPDYSEHKDYVQWALHDAFSYEDALEQQPQMVMMRLAILSFAAIQSSAITMTNAIFDIASSPDCISIQQQLRCEVVSVAAAHSDNQWSRAALAHMPHLDSALRESMRLWGFVSRGVMKLVVAPEGVTLPSGDHLPRGVKVGVTQYGVQHDESVYENAFSYDAFRFSRHAVKSDSNDQHSGAASLGVVEQSMVRSSDTFMAFSHGRHACPGRFFAANQMKLLLAAIATKYDIEPLAERPANPWLNNTIGPPMWDKIRVRRRLLAD